MRVCKFVVCIGVLKQKQQRTAHIILSTLSRSALPPAPYSLRLFHALPYLEQVHGQIWKRKGIAVTLGAKGLEVQIDTRPTRFDEQREWSERNRCPECRRQSDTAQFAGEVGYGEAEHRGIHECEWHRGTSNNETARTNTI